MKLKLHESDRDKGAAQLWIDTYSRAMSGLLSSNTFSFNAQDRDEFCARRADAAVEAFRVRCE